MEKLSESEELDYIIRALEDPLLRHSAEFSNWLSVPENKESFKKVLVFREAFLRRNTIIKLDENKEWAKFEHKLRQKGNRKTIRFITYWSIAAVAAILIGIFTLIPPYHIEEVENTTPVFYAQDIVQKVILRTDKGELIEPEKDVKALHRNGANLAKIAGTKGIKYDQRIESKQEETLHTLITPRGKSYKISLSDGTEVWLNAESQLRYPVAFNQGNRVVELQGEAYFKVAKDAKHPFIVKTDRMSTRVLGTEFNFRSYSYEGTHVTLVSGSVMVKRKGSEEEVKLHPGQDISLTDSEEFVLRQVDAREFTSWTSGFFYFKNVKLEEIMKTLGRWYNVNIEFADPQVMHYHFNFWADRNDTPERVIQLLNEVGKVKAELEDNTIIIR